MVGAIIGASTNTMAIVLITFAISLWSENLSLTIDTAITRPTLAPTPCSILASINWVILWLHAQNNDAAIYVTTPIRIVIFLPKRSENTPQKSCAAAKEMKNKDSVS